MLIEADFLKIPEKGRVAMLRQLADLNINKLMLARFLKDGDKLKIAYATTYVAKSSTQDIWRFTEYMFSGETGMMTNFARNLARPVAMNHK